MEKYHLQLLTNLLSAVSQNKVEILLAEIWITGKMSRSVSCPMLNHLQGPVLTTTSIVSCRLDSHGLFSTSRRVVSPQRTTLLGPGVIEALLCEQYILQALPLDRV